MVSEIWRYPVKSMQGETLTTAAVTPIGIEGDRGWGLADPATEKGAHGPTRAEDALRRCSTRRHRGRDHAPRRFRDRRRCRSVGVARSATSLSFEPVRRVACTRTRSTPQPSRTGSSGKGPASPGTTAPGAGCRWCRRTSLDRRRHRSYPGQSRVPRSRRGRSGRSMFIRVNVVAAPVGEVVDAVTVPVANIEIRVARRPEIELEVRGTAGELVREEPAAHLSRAVLIRTRDPGQKPENRGQDGDGQRTPGTMTLARAGFVVTVAWIASSPARRRRLGSVSMAARCSSTRPGARRRCRRRCRSNRRR